MSSADHLIRIAPEWSIWRTFCLRSAGFPTRLPLELASAATAHLLDAVAAHDAEIRASMLRVAEHAHEAMRATEDGAERSALKKAARALRAGRVPEQVPEPLVSDVEPLRAALDKRRALEVELRDAFARDSEATSEHLRALARDERFREALTWQNARVVHDALDPFVDHAGTDFKSRQRAQLIASYAQRYGLKNESIGFFGPIGWGELREEGRPIVLEPGDAVADGLEVFFERWALDVIADAIGKMPGMRQWIPPRRSPLVRVDGDTLHTPFGSFEPPVLHARVLAQCDGVRAARDVAAALRDMASADEVFAALDALVRQDLAVWRFELLSCQRRVEDTLLRALEAVGDDDLRARAHEILDPMLRARDAIASARGPAELSAAMVALDRTFTTLTGVAASRNAGQTYAARTLVRPLARRPLTLQLGPDVVRKLAPPLTLLATAARWWSHRISQEYAPIVEGVVHRLWDARGTREIDLIHLWPQLAPLFPRAGGTELPPAVSTANTEFQAIWTEILERADRTERRIHARAVDVEAAIQARFAAPAPGWPSARCHSPDLMIAARSADAIARGELTFVVGEVHAFSNTIEQLLFFSAHPDPTALQRSFAADQPRRLTPTGFAGGVHDSLSVSPRDVAIEHDWWRSWRPREQVVPISELVVAEEDGQMCVKTRDGRKCWSLYAAINSIFSTANLCRVLPEAPHTPRVTIDDVIIERETWRFSSRDLAFAQDEDPLRRFAGARSWARAHGMPRFCFYKSSAEIKPCYVDFDSAIFVDALAKAARGAERILVSEMVPAPDECWLVDREGNRYTCELRTVLVDDRTCPKTSVDR